MSTAKLKI